tara:strand:+ start:52866 stop:54203 length:1338 start_codon:yes stop_codon:yes gene_type:complete
MVAIASCAKKVENDLDKRIARTQRNQVQLDPVIHRFFQEQELGCDKGECHPSVAKLTIFERGALQFCSGVLVAPDVILTSSNCLTRNLKLPNISCLNNVHAVFPGLGSMKQESVKCDYVLSSNILQEDKDPALWRSDFAFLKLKTSPGREPLRISRDGLKEGQSYRQFKVDISTDTSAKLSRSKCQPHYNSYANPFSRERYSPMMTVSGCAFSEGNLGSPLLNESGEVVGLVSANMNTELRNYILANDMMLGEMVPIQHVSNLSCGDFPREVSAGRQSKLECEKTIDTLTLDRYRSRLLSSRKTHLENMKKIEKELEKPDKYFKWDIKFYANNKGNVLEAHFGRPKCFYDIDTWISEFSGGWRGRSVYTYGFIEMSHKTYRLETKLDSLLRPASTIKEEGMKNYKIEFNPASSYFEDQTDVTITGQLFDSSSEQNYSNITNICTE